MHLFEAVPNDLFSLLASPNRVIYADALMVLFDAFGNELKIPESTLYSMIRGRLENALATSTFENEGIYEDEAADLPGRARFLIRKLKEKGWIDIETGKDFEKYVIIPSYSIYLLELFSMLTNETKLSGFSYVYDTYTSLKSAHQDENAGDFEKMMALYGAAEKTQALVKTCKLVYHGINKYFQHQLEMSNVNDILTDHFDRFLFNVVETYIKPLKIKDSVPKYKVPIQRILTLWHTDDDILNGMTQAALKEKRLNTFDECKSDIVKKLFFVKDCYESLETGYLSEIDEKVRVYTRATTQKLEYLTNSDKTVRGNLIYLLNAMTDSPETDTLLKEIRPVFQICRQSFISEKSLYTPRNAAVKVRSDPIEVDDTPKDYRDSLRDFKAAVNSPFSKANVRKFMEGFLDGRLYALSDDFDFGGDNDYIMSLMAVLAGSDRDSFYEAQYLGGQTEKNGYQIPRIRFERKKQG